MSYRLTLEKAGARVLDFNEFGSYQGTWLAFVEYNGEKGIVEGSYGSCSGCDSFLAEFDFDDNEPIEREGKYYKRYVDEDNEIPKEEYDTLVIEHNKRLADFGRGYLSGGVYGKEHYENKLSKLDTNDWFDEETKEECEWAVSKFLSL